MLPPPGRASASERCGWPTGGGAFPFPTLVPRSRGFSAPSAVVSLVRTFHQYVWPVVSSRTSSHTSSEGEARRRAHRGARARARARTWRSPGWRSRGTRARATSRGTRRRGRGARAAGPRRGARGGASRRGMARSPRAPTRYRISRTVCQKPRRASATKRGVLFERGTSFRGSSSLLRTLASTRCRIEMVETSAVASVRAQER